jgi:hypothetical protein
MCLYYPEKVNSIEQNEGSNPKQTPEEHRTAQGQASILLIAHKLTVSNLQDLMRTSYAQFY